MHIFTLNYFFSVHVVNFPPVLLLGLCLLLEISIPGHSAINEAGEYGM